MNEQLTQDEIDRRKKVVAGYLASGNSVWDLITMLIDQGNGDQDWLDYYTAAVEDTEAAGQFFSATAARQYFEEVGQTLFENQMTTIDG